MGGICIGLKLNALIEVFLVYVVLIGAFDFFASFPSGKWAEFLCILLLFVILVSLAVARKDFSRYGISQKNSEGDAKAIVVFAASMLFLVIGSIWSAAVLTFLSVTKRDFSRYGITMRGLGSDLKIVAICIVPVMAVDVFTLYYSIGSFGGTLIYSALIVLLLFVILLLLTKVTYRENTIALRARTIVPVATAGSIISFITIVSTMTPQHFDGTQGLALKLVDALVFGFVIQAIPQQLLFGGYIQSRLNEAFGRPYKLLGVGWGAGIIVTALLFGLMHVIYHHYYLWGIWTFFFWLVYGFLREKTGNITVPTIIHGIEDAFFHMTW